MYGLPDSMVVGMAKRAGRVVVTREKYAERAEIADETMEAVILTPFAVAGSFLGFIEKVANAVGKRAERADRKMRAKRAKAKLKAGKL